MTKKETTVILSYLREAFKNFQVTNYTIDVWYDALSDLDFRETMLAVRRLVALNTFAPSIAEVRKSVLEVKKDLLPNEVEALEEVVRAVKDFGFYNESGAKDSMSELTRRVVDIMGFQNICLSEDHDGWRNDFMRLHRKLLEDYQKNNQLPQGLKEDIRALNDPIDSKMIQIGGTNGSDQ